MSDNLLTVLPKIFVLTGCFRTASIQVGQGFWSGLSLGWPFGCVIQNTSRSTGTTHRTHNFPLCPYCIVYICLHASHRRLPWDERLGRFYPKYGATHNENGVFGHIFPRGHSVGASLGVRVLPACKKNSE